MARDFNKKGNIFMITLGQKIKELRLSKALSQPQLAQTMGIEQSYLSKLENDKSFPSDDMLQSLLAALEVEISDFIGEFEPAYVRSHLAKLANVKQHADAVERVNTSFMMRWIIICAFFSVIGGTTLTSGVYGWFFKAQWSETYRYQSKGLIKPGESLRLFKDSKFVEFPDELISRLDHKIIDMKQESGDYFVRKEGDNRRLYTKMRRQDKQVDNSKNNWLAILGLLILLTGLAGLIIEPKIRRLKRFSG